MLRIPSEPGLTDVDPRQTDLALELFDERAARLEALLESADGTHYVPVIREEIERNDQARAQYFVALRRAVPDGDLRAVSEMQRLVLAHPESKNEARHLLHLGGLYENLAREYAANHPPESLHFDPVRFQELVDSGARIYEMVSQRDGTPEKIEAKRRLEAFIAFALRIDRDRFTP